ncbi:N-acetylglucosamine kinase [Virgisporangium ochraceum]|uniref:N-acetylglucosamine kinase n=1 Tax=Virgisporangium ochraceum TaxID=65505 RepID=UPI0019440A32|nr:BadF/BadG/BcrA/BcrD ATPase family protein [Virgisporangium ochraceum]
MSRTLVVGVDAGGTSTRCVVATLDGTVVARGRAGGANKNSSGGRLAETLGAALGPALSTVDREQVALGVLGAAGAGGAGGPVFRAAADEAWSDAGLGGEVVTVTDLEVAYAAGTAAPTGTLLIAGTGAIAARFEGGVPVRRADGYGWLLGDEGSAVWIGVRGLRAVLADLDGRDRRTALVDPACAALGVERPDDDEALAQALLAAAFARPPADLGAFARDVSAAADAGDGVAQAICHAAADRLLRTLSTVEPPPHAPVVLGGSVLLSPGPVAREVRAGIAAGLGIDPREAVDGAAGAAALAIARVTGAPVAADVHARLTGG